MSDDLEILVMQYLDGSMPEAERALFEARLQSDARAQELLREHESLDALLAESWEMPAVSWPMLSERISDAITDEYAPVRTYKIDFARAARRLAIAACLFIAGGVSVHAYLSYRAGGNQHVAVTPVDPIQTPPVVAVVVPAHHSPIDVSVGGIEVATGPAVADVSVGPPAQLAGGSPRMSFAEGVVDRAPRVIVASGAESAQDDSAQSPMY